MVLLNYRIKGLQFPVNLIQRRRLGYISGKTACAAQLWNEFSVIIMFSKFGNQFSWLSKCDRLCLRSLSSVEDAAAKIPLCKGRG